MTDVVYQSQQNATMAYKVQSGKGTQATGSGGKIWRQTGGAGGQLARTATASGEVRSDAMSTKGRLGTQKTTGAWTGEASLGSFEEILQAITLDTWEATALALSNSDFTSLTIASNVITFGGGSPITLGLRVGDVIRLTNMATAGNNGRNLRIAALDATTVTIAETDVLTDESSDTMCNITRPKKLWMQGTPLKRYYTVDEYDADIDQSEVMSDFMWGMAKLTMATDGILTWDISGVGTGQMEALATGSSPLLTVPTLTSNAPLSVVDATIQVNGVDVVDLTSFDITFDIAPAAPSVFGSGAIKYSPDVFPGTMQVSINLTALRSDLQQLTDFLDETVYSIHVLAVANESEPKDFFSLYVGNFTLGQAQKSALSKEGGPRTVTVQVPAALVGKDDAGVGHTPSMVAFQSTGA